MCLAVPGKILEIEYKDENLKMGKVSFGGIVKEVCLDLVPEAKTGDYVLVHVGFALNTIDEEEANKLLETLEEIFIAEEEFISKKSNNINLKS
ncbi:MAG: HypC/HybG/HupF family hydrogenase formation chaperone [Ignavibacteria bacterium]|nr:HypC/HybG/HupF family hydrogenase formation chaperone [Ignavibacteria bacterium]